MTSFGKTSPPPGDPPFLKTLSSMFPIRQDTPMAVLSGTVLDARSMGCKRSGASEALATQYVRVKNSGQGGSVFKRTRSRSSVDSLAARARVQSNRVCIPALSSSLLRFSSGCSQNGQTVLDPFGGTGTTAVCREISSANWSSQKSMNGRCSGSNANW